MCNEKRLVDNIFLENALLSCKIVIFCGFLINLVFQLKKNRFSIRTYFYNRFPFLVFVIFPKKKVFHVRTFANKTAFSIFFPLRIGRSVRNVNFRLKKMTKNIFSQMSIFNIFLEDKHFCLFKKPIY